MLSSQSHSHEHLRTRTPEHLNTPRTKYEVPKHATWILALIGLLLVASPVHAQQVTARLSTDSVTVGDRFTLTLVAEHPFRYTPVFPDPQDGDSVFGDLEVISRSEPSAQSVGSGIQLDSVVYEVTTFALDTAYVPAIRVPFSADADTTSAASLPLILPVTSLVPADAQGIQDLAPLVEFPAPIWPYVLLGLAILILIATILYYLRERRRQPPPPPPAPPEPEITPYEAAMTRLRALSEEEALAMPERVKPFYVELSDLLRTYLEDRLGVPALERTTRELMYEMEARTVRYRLPGPAPNRIKEILTLADLVKFADYVPPTEQGYHTLDETRKAIDSIETKQRQIAPEPPTPPVIETETVGN